MRVILLLYTPNLGDKQRSAASRKNASRRGDKGLACLPEAADRRSQEMS